MEKQTVFIKVKTRERLPSKGHITFFRRVGNESITHWFGKYDDDETIERYAFWLEEIELPSDYDLPLTVSLVLNKMYHDIDLQKAWNNGVNDCANFIISHLKNK